MKRLKKREKAEGINREGTTRHSWRHWEKEHKGEKVRKADKISFLVGAKEGLLKNTDSNLASIFTICAGFW